MNLFPGQVLPAGNNIIFTDVSEKWQQDAINAAFDLGVMEGYPDGTFKPNQQVTEAEFAVMITRFAAGIKPTDAGPGVHWGQPYYDALAEYEMPLRGYENTLLRDKPLTRGLAARIIARIYGYDLNVGEAVDFMYANNLSSGRNGVKNFEGYGAFDFLTRVEAAAIFMAVDRNKTAVFKDISSDLNRGHLVNSVLYHSPALPVLSPPGKNGRYALFQGQTYIGSTENILQAEQYASQFPRTYLVDQAKHRLIWANFNKAIEFSDDTKQGNLFLVNPNSPVGEAYRADKMVNLADRTSYSLRVSYNDMFIDEAVLNPLQNMLNDIYYAGATKLMLISAYRSYQTQTMLFEGRVSELLYTMNLEDARKQVARSTAVPGTSEHQAGLAIDFATLNNMTTAQSFADTREGTWLTNNSFKYGFTVRYTADKSYLTGIISEPWHLRYVGVPHAEVMLRSGMCLEEYLDYIRREQMISFTDYLGEVHGIYYFDSVNSADLLAFIYLSDNVASISGDGQGGLIATTNN